MSRASGHMSVRRGKRVRVFLKSGESVDAKFKEKTDKRVEFFDHKPIATGLVKTLTILKGEL